MNNKLNIFAFSAHRNYSTDFGWANEMKAYLEEETSFKEAVLAETAGVKGGCAWNYELPRHPEVGVFQSFWNDHGGSQNAYGWVIANSKEEAEELLQAWTSKFEVIEYQE